MNEYNQIKVTTNQADSETAIAVMTAMDFFGGLMIEDFSDIDTCPWDYVDEELLKAIREHEGAIYLVSYPWAMIVHPITLEPFGLRGNVKDCSSFGSNLTMYQSNFSLCKLSKITEKNGE